LINKENSKFIENESEEDENHAHKRGTTIFCRNAIT
jgi:hypothetical protein